MAQTKFSAGERASINRGGIGAPAGVCEILFVLPRGSGPQQYRVRSQGETFERVIDEARLEHVRYE